MAALQSMGAYLRSLKSFAVDAATTNEDVLDDGEKVQYSGVATLLVHKPSGLRVESSDDRHERLYLYDGKSFTLYAERTKFYATVPAAGTLAELVDTISEKYDVSMPLVDLFRWGRDDTDAEASGDEIVAARAFGPSVVAGTTCAHYGFRQADVDWQIWIQKGDFPLPRKLVITTKTDEARPQHTSVYTWNLAPSYNAEAFTFAPPAGAQRVLLAPSALAAAVKD